MLSRGGTSARPSQRCFPEHIGWTGVLRAVVQGAAACSALKQGMWQPPSSSPRYNIWGNEAEWDFPFFLVEVELEGGFLSWEDVEVGSREGSLVYQSPEHSSTPHPRANLSQASQHVSWCIHSRTAQQIASGKGDEMFCCLSLVFSCLPSLPPPQKGHF